MYHTFIPIAMFLLFVALSALLAGLLGFGKPRRAAPPDPPPQPSPQPPPLPPLRLAAADDNAPELRLVPCWFNLPLEKNDHQPVAPEVLAAIKKRIRERFGFYTVIPGVYGFWTREESQIRLEVSVRENRVTELAEFVRAIGGELGETHMYFIALNAVAMLLPTIHARTDDDDIAKAA